MHYLIETINNFVYFNDNIGVKINIIIALFDFADRNIIYNEII